MAEVVVRSLSAAGYNVEYFGDGLEAWERMSGAPGDFDLLITDHQMPGLTGLELVELLRQVNYPGWIIVHAGAVTKEEAARYRSFGVQAVIAKTTDVSELLRTVEPLATGAGPKSFTEPGALPPPAQN